MKYYALVGVFFIVAYLLPLAAGRWSPPTSSVMRRFRAR